MINCNTCKSESPCIGIPKNADSWNIPNYTGCDVGSLPKGICEGFSCLEKVPACSIEGGHINKLIKLSNYIDLDALASFDPKLVQDKISNIDILSKITSAPVLGVKDGINTVAHMHCDGTIQVDLVTPISLTERKHAQYCNASGTRFLVSVGDINNASIQVFVLGVLVTDFSIDFNGTNTFIDLNTPVSNACLDIYWENNAPVVVPLEDENVKVSATDVAGFLENKIDGGTGIIVTSESFGSTEYLSIALEQPLPTPAATDVNKILYYDGTGYKLGTPCCDADLVTVIGTDDVELVADNNTLDFESDTLDIIVSDSDNTDGKIEVDINIKADTELFNISNISGSSKFPVEYASDLIFKSDDNSVEITVEDNVINFKETPQTLLPVTYSFTDGDTREVELGDSIIYKSDDLDIIDNGENHIFNLKEVSYGGRMLNGSIVQLGSNETVTIPLNQSYAINNNAMVNGNGLAAQSSALHHVVANVGVIFANSSTNAGVVTIQVNGNDRAVSTVSNIDTSQYTFSISQYVELSAGDVITIEVRSFTDGFTLLQGLYNTYLYVKEER